MNSIGPVVAFFVPGKPATAGSKRGFVLRRRDGSLVTRGNGTPVVNIVENDRRSKDWRGDIKRFANDEYTGPMLTGALCLTLTFFLERPKFHSGKRGLLPSAPVHPIVKPDLLKMARAVEDALTGVLWSDDAQIVTELLKKRFVSGPMGAQGVLIEVRPEL